MMRRVAGGEADGLRHSTVIGMLQRDPGSRILKEEGDGGKVPTLEETGAFDGPWEEDESEGSDDGHAVWSALMDAQIALGMLGRQGNEMAARAEDGIGDILRELGLGKQGSDSDEDPMAEFSNVKVTPRDDPGRIRREGPPE